MKIESLTPDFRKKYSPMIYNGKTKALSHNAKTKAETDTDCEYPFRGKPEEKA